MEMISTCLHPNISIYKSIYMLAQKYYIGTSVYKEFIININIYIYLVVAV